MPLLLFYFSCASLLTNFFASTLLILEGSGYFFHNMTNWSLWNRTRNLFCSSHPILGPRLNSGCGSTSSIMGFLEGRVFHELVAAAPDVSSWDNLVRQVPCVSHSQIRWTLGDGDKLWRAVSLKSSTVIKFLLLVAMEILENLWSRSSRVRPTIRKETTTSSNIPRKVISSRKAKNWGFFSFDVFSSSMYNFCGSRVPRIKSIKLLQSTSMVEFEPRGYISFEVKA